MNKFTEKWNIVLNEIWENVLVKLKKKQTIGMIKKKNWDKVALVPKKKTQLGIYHLDILKELTSILKKYLIKGVGFWNSQNYESKQKVVRFFYSDIETNESKECRLLERKNNLGDQ